MNVLITCSFLHVRITNLIEKPDFNTLCFRRRPTFVRTPCGRLVDDVISIRAACNYFQTDPVVLLLTIANKMAAFDFTVVLCEPKSV